MKFIMKVKIPNPHGNELLKNPHQFGATMKQLLEEVKAEAAYFTTIDGCRGGYVVVNLDDAVDIPKIAEPFFFALKAEIEWIPVMTPEVLGRAVGSIDDVVKKYAR
jgi:hypothetical protein